MTIVTKYWWCHTITMARGRKVKQKSVKKGNSSSFKNRGDFNKKKKPKVKSVYKHIQRNQEAEDELRRSKLAETKYQNKFEAQQEASSESEEEDPFNALLETLNKNGKKRKAIESSDEDVENSDDEGVEIGVDEDESGEMEENEDELNSDDEDGSIQDVEGELDSNDDLTDSENGDVGENTSNSDDEEKAIEEDDTELLGEEEGAESDEETEEEFDEDLEEGDESNHKDPFIQFLDYNISSELLESVLETPRHSEKILQNWNVLGKLQIEIPRKKSSAKKVKKSLLSDNEVHAAEGCAPIKIDTKAIDLNELCIKAKLHNGLEMLNKSNLEKYSIESSRVFTNLQCELFSIMNNYQDLYYPQRNINDGEELRSSYCLHALNHVLKTRTKVLHHNAKLKQMKEANKNSFITPESCRDQGLSRPKVLIILPFRESALRTVNMMITLLYGANNTKHVLNYKRFHEEFYGDNLYASKRNPKPEDYGATFVGNTDDTFRIGISLTKQCLKLYSKYAMSDIIIASPLGLRLTIGAAGESDRDFDFLASVEMLIMDQAELFYAQNWDHVLHILNHLHLQPKSTSNTDFSRIRPWCLNGWSRFYHQTLLFTTHDLPEFRSLFNNRFLNYRGKVRTINPITSGSIRHITIQIPQVFHRIDVTSLATSFDARFNYFTSKILSQYEAPSMAHCLIYVPSYFDFVRLRNYFKKEELNFGQICEYTKPNKIARARDMFYHGSSRFLLYSERGHFFKRTRIKGIRHIIMYQPPNWPHFYSEMLNLMHDTYQNPRDGFEANSMTCTVLYTKYDALQMSAIVGTEQASKMARSDKTTHMFMSDD